MKILQNNQAVNANQVSRPDREDYRKQPPRSIARIIDAVDIEDSVQLSKGSRKSADIAVRLGVLLHENSFEQAALAVQHASTSYPANAANAANEMTESASNSIRFDAETAMLAHSGLSPERVWELIS